MSQLLEVKNLLLISGTSSDDVISSALVAGARIIADQMPMEKIVQFSTSATAATYTLTNQKFISIHSTNSRPLIPISPENYQASLLPGSIYKVTTAGNQFYTINGNVITVSSTSNSLKTYTYPSITTAGVLSNLPNEYIYGAVLYAAANTITKLLINTNYAVSQVSITMPEPPSVPTLIYDDVSETVTINDGTVTTVDVAVYTPPTLILNNIDTLITTHSSDFSPAISLTFPAITYTNSFVTGPDVITIGNIEALVESFSTPSTFTMPTIVYALDMGSIALPTNISNDLLNIASEDVTPLLSDLTVTIGDLDAYFTTLDGTSTTAGYINTLQDIELASSKMSEMQIKLKEVETELTLKLQEQIKNIEQKNDIEKSNKAQKLSSLIQKADAYIKRYSVELQKFQAQFTLKANEAQLKQQGELAKLKSEIDIQTGKANEKMLIFKTAVEKLFEQAKIELQKQLQLSSLTTDIAQKNAVAKYQQTVSSNEATIKEFSTKLEQWVQTENLKFGKFKATIEFFLSDNQSKIQDFQVREAIALNTFNTALSKVRENYQKDLAIVSLNVQKAIKKAEIETDIKKQNELNTYVARYNTYQEGISRFVQQIGLVQVQVQRDMALINSNIQNNESEKQKLMGLQKSLIDQFNNFIAMMFPRQQAQPQQQGQ